MQWDRVVEEMYKEELCVEMDSTNSSSMDIGNAKHNNVDKVACLEY
jgi:hypothetical protein